MRLSEQQSTTKPDVLAKLPAKLNAIVDRSLRLQSRILHLDRVIYQPAEERAPPVQPMRPLKPQLELLRAAFATGE